MGPRPMPRCSIAARREGAAALNRGSPCFVNTQLMHASCSNPSALRVNAGNLGVEGDCKGGGHPPVGVHDAVACGLGVSSACPRPLSALPAL